MTAADPSAPEVRRRIEEVAAAQAPLDRPEGAGRRIAMPPVAAPDKNPGASSGGE